MIRKLLPVMIVALAAFSAACSEGSGIDAYVVRVDESCAVIVSNDSKATSEDAAYRFYGIGIPSQRQPFGPEARTYIEKMLPKGTRVSINKLTNPSGTDSLPEALIQVYGKSLNYALISEGLAWVDRQKCKGLYCRRWHIEEHKVIEAGKGIWSVNVSTPPWQWGE